MTALVPRPYQIESAEAVRSAWEVDRLVRPALVLPTGAGKTVVFAKVIREWREQEKRTGRNRRALVVAHRHELLEQARSQLANEMPDTSVGIVQGARNGTLSPIVVASILTLARERRRAQLLNVGLVVCDEAHHGAAKSYVDTFRHFGLFDEWAEDGPRSLGVSATLARDDGLALGDVWQRVVYSVPISDMIGQGYLVRPVGMRLRVRGLDLSRVRRSGGDFSSGSLGQALEDADAPELIAKACVEHLGARRTILFAPLVHTTQVIRDKLREVGFAAEMVSGETPPEERRRIVADFRAGKIQILCNAMIFTEGTDLPFVEAIVIARPTRSRVLWMQMVGRGLRTSPDTGKRDCLVMDFVGASALHGLATCVDMFGETSPLEEVIIGADDAGDEDETEQLEVEPAPAVPLEDLVDDRSWLNGGDLVVEHVDLFRASKSGWLRTRAGVWFIPAGERFIVILPAPVSRGGGFDVLWIHRDIVGRSDWIMRGVADFGRAQGWAEAALTPDERGFAARRRGNRSRQPSPSQRLVARAWGVPVMPGMTFGEVSAAIHVAVASARIDPRLPRYMTTDQ